jgi:hypothetical protein
VERPLAPQRLVERHAERELIGACIDRVPEELFGRHVARRAGANARLTTRGGKAEVHEPHLARGVEHDVRGLEIAMQHAAVVRGGESRAELPGDVERLVFRKPSDAPQGRRQILAVHELHRKKQMAGGLADVVDAADVGMRDLARGAHFVVKLREPPRVLADFVRQELQRDRLTEPEIIRAIDLAHATAADEADHAVAAFEHRPRRESPVADGSGRGEPAASAAGGVRVRRRCWRHARALVGRRDLEIRVQRMSAGGAEPGTGRRRGPAGRASHRPILVVSDPGLTQV